MRALVESCAACAMILQLIAFGCALKLPRCQHTQSARSQQISSFTPHFTHQLAPKPSHATHFARHISHKQPRVQVQADAAVAPPPPAPHRYFHRHVFERPLVLSVDDDPVNQTVVSSLLEPLGFRMLMAGNGAEALAMLAAEPALPDVVLLDCMMPGMSGYEVCTRLRATHGAPPVLRRLLADLASGVRNTVGALHECMACQAAKRLSAVVAAQVKRAMRLQRASQSTVPRML